MPSYTVTVSPPTRTATAQPAATPSPAATASPTATQKPTGPVQVYLPQGMSDFIYSGPTLPADRALAAIGGLYEIIYFTPAGSTSLVAYRPGVDPVPPALPSNTLVRISMKRAANLVMRPPG
jgi:hypothetical protein